jgi:signal transduction histidine kinase
MALVVDAEAIPRLPLATEEALYRIGQEAIHNIVKHANASRAAVRLARDGDLVRLTVTDDGGGFAPGDVPRGHLGLLGMRQRLDLIGGELRVESAPGRGTTVDASVPVADEAAE